MASRYWLKLYHEILHDPKMGTLSDRLWRRCIEMFLLAGDYDNEGHLPPIEDMAWALRTDADELSGELEALAIIGILSMNKDDDTWHVTKWVERQGPVTGAERTRRHRERKRSATYYGNDDVTKRHTDIDIDRDKEVEVEQKHDDDFEFRKLGSAWANARGGLVNPLDSEELRALMEEYTYQWVYDAIIEANSARSRGRNISMNFVKAILSRWQQEGRDTPYDHIAKVTEAVRREAVERDQRKVKEWEAKNLGGE